MASEFVHLHLHSQYSLLQGAIHLENLFDRLKTLEMDTVAITDTHNLFGAIDFYLAAKKAGVKPIIGCELLYTPNPVGPSVAGGTQAQKFPKHHHLVVLCKDLAGYRNLCRMITKPFMDPPPPQKGQGSGPRATVSRELLDQFGDGLIVLSGCMRG